jgi:hypothetical protein
MTEALPQSHCQYEWRSLCSKKVETMVAVFVFMSFHMIRLAWRKLLIDVSWPNLSSAQNRILSYFETMCHKFFKFNFPNSELEVQVGKLTICSFLPFSPHQQRRENLHLPLIKNSSENLKANSILFTVISARAASTTISIPNLLPRTVTVSLPCSHILHIPCRSSDFRRGNRQLVNMNSVLCFS